MNMKHVLGLAGVAGLMVTAAVLTRPTDSTAAGATPPRTMTLTAVVRDFKAAEEAGGHPDFQAFSGRVHFDLLERELDGYGKPVFASDTGRVLPANYRDDQGRPINPVLVLEGTLEAEIPGRIENTASPRLTSAERFDQWYRDAPGVNVSMAVPLVLHEKTPDSGIFVFDSHDPTSVSLNEFLQDLPVPGYFPINGRGFGNYEGFDGARTNYHFTTEIATTFTYERGVGQVFGFTGDDDLWVFIGGRNVIDLGGVHPAAEQWIDLDRLDWLVDGEEYSFHLFHAERRTVASNFRIETTVPLMNRPEVQTYDSFD